MTIRKTAIAVLLVATATYAATNRTWTGNAGAPGNWSVASNWNSLPDAGDNLFFYSSAQTLSTNDRGDDFAVRKFEIEPGASAYTFAGDRIALSGTGIFNDSSFLQTFAADISLSGAATAVVANSDVLFSGTLIGSGGLAPRGTSEVTLNGANAFTGNLSVQCVVNVNTIKTNSSPSAVGRGSRIVLGNGSATGTLNYTGTGDPWSRNMKIGENTGGAGDTGGGRINNNGTGGALVITNAQSFTANNLAIAPRTLTFGGDNSNANEMQMAIIDNHTANGGIVNVAKADSGKWILSGSNTYTGTTTVSGGALIVTGSIATSSGITVSDGASLQGTGTMPAIGGAGSVDPGDSPGIMTATQVNPTGGLDFNFELTGDTINWSPINNDVLRLTDGTTSFTASLDGDNVINLYLSSALAAGLASGDVLMGGFYTDSGNPLASVSGAVLNVFTEDGGGAVTYNGTNYTPIEAYASMTIGTIADPQFSGAGFLTTFTYTVPEPSVIGLLGLSLVSCAIRRHVQ